MIASDKVIVKEISGEEYSKMKNPKETVYIKDKLCPGCLEEEKLTKHHIIPRWIRKVSPVDKDMVIFIIEQATTKFLNKLLKVDTEVYQLSEHLNDKDKKAWLVGGFVYLCEKCHKRLHQSINSVLVSCGYRRYVYFGEK